MAHVEVNTALGAIHGQMDGYVFRKQGDKTLCYRLPENSHPIGAGQSKVMRTFADASHWVRTIIKPNPVLKALYRQRGRERRKGRLNFRQMAIRDYFHAPKISELDQRLYRPSSGGRLVVHATDDFEVVRVHVVLRDAGGAAVAEGDAALVYGVWHFEAPSVPPGGKLPASAEVTAFDRPENVAARTFSLLEASAETGTSPAVADAPPPADTIPGYV